MEGEGETDVSDSVTPTVGLFLFFSLAPSLLFPFFLSFTGEISRSSSAAASSPPLSLEPSVITVQSPGFYRRSNVATGSGGFRSLDVWTIEKSIRTGRSYIPPSDVDAAVRCSFSKIFYFFGLLCLVIE